MKATTKGTMTKSKIILIIHITYLILLISSMSGSINLSSIILVYNKILDQEKSKKRREYRTMKPLNFFIVFHDNVFPENTSDFTESEMKEFFTWVAVNEKIPKAKVSGNLVEEWKMKKHSPLFQMLNFYQNSVFYHLAWNSELIHSRYIGFGQYDMKIGASEFRQVYQVISSKGEMADKIFAPFLYGFDALYSSPIDRNGWITCFLNPYNEFFGMDHTLESLAKLPLSLLHTFIMPTWFFLHIMPFVENLTPIILRALNWETRHLAGTLERVFALCISCGILERKLNLVPLTGFQHIEDQHSEDKLRGILNKKSID